ncbi:MAG: selenide, water dikinase SelD [Bacteroidetes bacterium]|nr:selenide, water dikinase SelD [Bacteroidota bacterium]
MTGLPLLTSLSKGSGCGCKIQPAVLHEMLHGLRIRGGNELLLVGNDLNDDCSVLDIDNGQLLLQTVDFFTPLVNDPYVFGYAAAANSLGDIWAMGGRPLMANAVFSWPLDVLPLEMARQVLQGGADCCAKAGIALSGGHSIEGQEPLFGLSVSGICSRAELKTNAGAKPGDILFLTRPLGVGMLAAAHKKGISSPEQDQALYHALQQLNAVGDKLGKLPAVHAMTDVTGFGLAGHLLEMCRAAHLQSWLLAESIPRIHEAEPLAASFVLPDNAMRNWNAFEKYITLENQSVFPWLVDPQTNGGLLIAADPASESDVVQVLSQMGLCAEKIGGFTETGSDSEPRLIVQ